MPTEILLGNDANKSLSRLMDKLGEIYEANKEYMNTLTKKEQSKFFDEKLAEMEEKAK